MPGRRSYTEEELQNALQDILSGKLGTRRAAVLYGIPRSTLRNKVYKLALEQKREAIANNPPEAILECDDDDKDSGAEDDKDLVDRNHHGLHLPQNDLSRLSSSQHQLAAMQNFMKLSEPKETKTSISPNMSNATNPWMSCDTNALLQSILLAGGGLGAFSALMQASPEDLATLPEILRKNLAQQQELAKESSNDHMNSNGMNSDPRMMLQTLLQQQTGMNKSRPPGTPETSSSVEMNDGNDHSEVILKIPSYKPLAGSSSSGHSKNGDANTTPSTSPLIQSSLMSKSPLNHHSHAHQNHMSLMSPSLSRQRSESESPPISSKFSISDVIAKSISKNFQSSLMDQKHSFMDPMDQYKRPSISVIKNLGSADRFGSNPNISHMSMSSQLSPNTGTGGKGTRPKRGKYRNYDRDSLVEAVKAVQRGEMSVHRAGSYYGVPHSTLEYKVKERHLMRPRKREPKPQTMDDRTTPSLSVKPQDLCASSSTGMRSIDKSKVLPNAKMPLKPPYPSSSPNGMKMPFMDPLAMQQYTSQLFWQHPGGFPNIPGLDFARSSSNPASFPPNAENLFTQQMLQKLQEEQARNANAFKTPTNGNQSKSPRDLAESLYEGGTNGSSSFLDGIIRHSLDKKANDISQGALFEQLLKNTRKSLPNSSSHSDDDDNVHGLKRSGSPLNFSHHTDIKRERASPSSVETDSEYLQQEQKNISKDAMENLLKLRDNLSLHAEDMNGSLHSEENYKHAEISDNKS